MEKKKNHYLGYRVWGLGSAKRAPKSTPIWRNSQVLSNGFAGKPLESRTGLDELQSKLLKRCYIGDYMGEYYRGY